MRRKLGSPILTVAPLLVALALTGARADADESPPATAASAIAIPDLNLRTVTGEPISLHETLARGPVLVNFWALWCKPCLKELPELQKLHDDFSAAGFTVLAINGDSPADVARVAPFVRARRYSFPVITDLDGALRRRFQSNAFPTSLLLDSGGKTIWTNQGYRPGDEVTLREHLARILPAAEPDGD